jgi:hypothetical protein
LRRLVQGMTHPPTAAPFGHNVQSKTMSQASCDDQSTNSAYSYKCTIGRSVGALH